MMSSLDFPPEHYSKLDTLLKVIKRYAQPNGSRIKILTGNEYVKNAVEQTEEYQDILVYSSLDKAMDSLLGLKADNIAHDEVVREKLLTTTAPKKEQDETLQLRFDEKSAAAGRGEAASTGEVGKESALFNREVEVAVVDDDIVIQELLKTVFSDTKWKLQIYQNGREFITDKQNHEFSLTFLDLMMPEMNGFEVLEHLKKENDNLPVIVFSALSCQETVVKAVSYGIKSYLTKPLKPEQLLRKAEEVLSLSF
jgi:CheY-like chemotaxis protein